MIDRATAMRASAAIVQALGQNVARCVAEIGQMYNREGENYERRNEIVAKWGVSEAEMRMAARIVESFCIR